MGTRSLTVVKDQWGEKEVENMVMYRHWDGYISGHGADLANFLKDFVVGNGIGSDSPEKYANGMDCLAAQIVAHFKQGVGNIYLQPSGTRDMGEEYIYTIYSGKTSLSIKVEEGYGEEWHLVFDGPLQDFIEGVKSGALEEAIRTRYQEEQA